VLLTRNPPVALRSGALLGPYEKALKSH